MTSADGAQAPAVTFTLNWLATPGTQLLLAGLLTMLVLRIQPRVALRAYEETLVRLRGAIVTVTTVLALAYVMNLSGETVTIGLWAAGAGGVFALISPLIGWLGVAITGSVTASNSLLGELQVAAARDAGLSPTLVAAGNSTGGVLAKMLSPQHLAIAAAAAGMAGGEGDLMRSVLKWSIALVALMCVIVYLQSTAVLSWMVPSSGTVGSGEHVGDHADDEYDECCGDQQPRREPRRPIGHGPRRRIQARPCRPRCRCLSRRDVGWGDEHLTRSGGPELRRVEAGARRTTDSTSERRSRPCSNSASASSPASGDLDEIGGHSRSPPNRLRKSRKTLKMSRKMLAAITTAPSSLARRSRLKS